MPSSDVGRASPKSPKRLALADTASLLGQLEFLQQADERLRSADQTVRDSLSSSPIFSKCDQILPNTVVNKAERKILQPGESLALLNGGPAYIVERGQLKVTVGNDGTHAHFGCGKILNLVGLLGLAHEADPFKPMDAPVSLEAEKARAKCGGPYEVFAPNHASMSLFADRRGRVNLTVGPAPGEACVEDFMCYFALCPAAAYKMHPSSNLPRLNDWLPLRAEGAPFHAKPQKDSDGSEDESEEASDVSSEGSGGAAARGSLHLNAGGTVSVAVLTMPLIEEVGWCLGQHSEQAVRLRKSLQVFKDSSKALTNIWRSLVSRCSAVFPGVPPEVVWAIAEQVESSTAEPGEVFVKEGDMCEDLILIEEGAAVVEKIVADGRHCSTTQIGKLGPGALIGDIALIGTGMPRPGTVRALTMVELLRIPASAMLNAMQVFPGMLDGLTPRIREAGNFLAMKLPVRGEVLHCLELLENVDSGFRMEVAANSSRKVVTLNQVIADGSTGDDNVYVLEYGYVRLEAPGTMQQCAVVGPNSVFAVNHTPAGKCEFPGSVARVLGPFAMVIQIKSKELQEALQRHYDKKPLPFDKMDLLKKGMRIFHVMQATEIFSKCSAPFIEELCKGVDSKSYMPGQTLCVKGLQDKAQMFLIRGGTLFFERDGSRRPDNCTMVGDLVMLGAAHHRQHTVRAHTFVFTTEISRTVFLKALSKFPDERKHLEAYARKAIGSTDDQQDGDVQWPMQKSAPKRLSYLLNLFAARRWYERGDDELKRLADECAVLVVQGKAAIYYDDGRPPEDLGPGDCFNEQILLGLEGGRKAGLGRFECQSVCELQFVSLEIWDKVISEFPDEQKIIFKSIRDCMADKAAFKRHGYNLGSAEIVRMSRLLRSLSDKAVEDLKGHFESMVVKPGTEIVSKGKRERALYILLSGTIYAESGKRGMEYTDGKVFGEAEVLGVSKAYNTTMRAQTTCILVALKIADFWHVLQDHIHDCELVEPLCREAAQSELSKLDQRIHAASGFAEARSEFVSVICEHVEDAFFGPGEAVMLHHAHTGEICEFGTSEMYLLLAGDAIVETELGVEQARLTPGEVFGEAGALGLENKRNSTVRASPTGCLHCAKLHPFSVEAAFRMNPQEMEPFEQLLERRREQNADFAIGRKQWLTVQAVPALAKTPLFCKHAQSLLADVAAPLIENSYVAGEVIAMKASQADSMLVMLEGSAQVEAQDGRPLGLYPQFSSLGEMAVLGLLNTRPATIRAATDCRVLVVKEDALKRALSLPERVPEEIEAFQRLVESRQEQVDAALPMSSLPIQISQDDLCAKAIALQAEMIQLQPGETLDPLPGDTPLGESFAVLSEGRAVLELASDNPRLRRLGGNEDSAAVPVVSMAAGSLLLEDMVAEQGCRVRAFTAVTIYRVRYLDFDVAVNLESCSQTWLARFRMLEADTRALLAHRGGSARGVVDSFAAHGDDDFIHAYRDRKQKAVGNAYRTKVKKGGAYDLPHMPERSSTLSSPDASIRLIERGRTSPISWLSDKEKRRLGEMKRFASTSDLRRSRTSKWSNSSTSALETASHLSSPDTSVRLPKLNPKATR